MALRCTGKLPSPSSTCSAEHWDWGAKHQNWGAEPRNGSTKHQKGWKGVGEPLPWLQPKRPQAAGGGRGWEWGKEKIPTRFTEQTSQEQPLCSAFERAHGNGTRPEPFPPGTAKRVPVLSPARPGLPRVTARCHRLSHVPRQGCRARRDTNGTDATRTSPGKKFLTLARTQHVPSLSHSPPKLLVFCPLPSDTPGNHSNYSNLYQSPSLHTD